MTDADSPVSTDKVSLGQLRHEKTTDIATLVISRDIVFSRCSCPEEISWIETGMSASVIFWLKPFYCSLSVTHEFGGLPFPGYL